MKNPCPNCGKPKQHTSIYCSDCVSSKKEWNANWRGGRIKHHAGYIYVLAPWHPRTPKNRYIFEHILVMEEHLDRFLTPNETIHHKNGIRDDNRIENLELWASNHPAGSRAGDLLEWAYEIIEKYEGPRLVRPAYY